MKKKPKGRTVRYLPSPQEIARRCKRLQREWTDDTERRRAGCASPPGPYVPALYRIDISRLGGPAIERVD